MPKSSALIAMPLLSLSDDCGLKRSWGSVSIAIDLARNSAYVAGSDDGRIFLVKLKPGAKLCQPLARLTGSNSLVFSPSDDVVYVAGYRPDDIIAIRVACALAQTKRCAGSMSGPLESLHVRTWPEIDVNSPLSLAYNSANDWLYLSDGNVVGFVYQEKKLRILTRLGPTNNAASHLLAYLASDPDSSMVFAFDYANNAIMVIAKDGSIRTLLRSGLGDEPGPHIFNRANGLAYSPKRKIIFVSTGLRILEFTLQGVLLREITSAEWKWGDRQRGIPGSLPGGLAVDDVRGILYCAAGDKLFATRF